MTTQAQVMQRMREFQERNAFLVCAVNQVPPFDATLDWPKEIAGVKMEHHVAWMNSAYWIAATASRRSPWRRVLPPMTCPLGIQLVAAYREDFSLLQFTRRFEQATNIGARRPAIAL